LPLRKHKSRKTRSVKNNRDRLESLEDSSTNPSIPSDFKPDSDKRRHEYLRASKEQVGNATASVVDLSVTFRGPSQAYYVFTAAHAKSLVSGSSNYLFFYNQKLLEPKDDKQVCLSANFVKPQVPIVNFFDALEFDPKSTASMIMNAGESCQSGGQANVKAQLTRTKEYEDFIQKWPLSKECAADISKNHTYLLRDCQNVTYRADDLKNYIFNVTYDSKFPNFVKYRFYQLYAILRHGYHRHVYEDPFNVKLEPNHLDVVLRLNNVSTYFNMTVLSDLGESKFIDVPVKTWDGDMLTVNPRTSPFRRFYDYQLPLYSMPTCAMDVNGINTFDNATFYTHFDSGHTYKVMQVKDKDVTVTVKKIDVSMKVQELYKDVKVVTERATVEIKHNSEKPDVYFQNQKISYTNKYATPLSIDHSLFGYVYGLPKKSVMVVLLQNEISFVYDNQRFLVQASNIYRNKTKGLCGNMDGERITDTLTPFNCYEMDFKKFINAFTDQNNDHKSNTCFPFFPIHSMEMSTFRTQLLSSSLLSMDSSSSSSSKSSSESLQKPNSHSSSSSSSSSSSHSHSHSKPSSFSSSSRSSNSMSMSHSNSSSSSSSSSSSRSMNPSSHSKTTSESSSSETNESLFPTRSSIMSNTVRPNILRKQNMISITKVVRRENDVCFSIEPLLTCIDSSHAADTKVLMQPFVCFPDSPASEHYLKLIKKGVNPDLSRKKNTVQFEVKIPFKCVKN
ncbi:VWD domain-containing protein, partial [Salmonella enterica subsp. enterica serovar Typhimurium]|nr:VWD domain-containing protein [Salmonella enterica subsp. enterica serovar Typhimurium]